MNDCRLPVLSIQVLDRNYEHERQSQRMLIAKTLLLNSNGTADNHDYSLALPHSLLDFEKATRDGAFVTREIDENLQHSLLQRSSP